MSILSKLAMVKDVLDGSVPKPIALEGTLFRVRVPDTGAPQELKLAQWLALPAEERVPERSVTITAIRGKRFAAVVIEPATDTARWRVIGAREELGLVLEAVRQSRGALMTSLPSREAAPPSGGGGGDPDDDCADENQNGVCDALEDDWARIGPRVPTDGSPGLPPDFYVLARLLSHVLTARRVQLIEDDKAMSAILLPDLAQLNLQGL